MRKKISTSLAVGVIGAMLALITGTGTALADSKAIDFEPTTYVPGSIQGQDGWGGSGIPINPNIDQEIVNPQTSGDATFGTQSFRISNSFTSGTFGDWPFSPSLSE